MNTTNYPTILSVEHESNPRLYETPYNTYASYSDYATPSKLEAFDYNYWPANTHNILTIPTTSAATPTINSIQTPPSTNPIIETLGSNSSVHLSQINSTTTFSSTHHHHIHQHIYPPSTPSNDPSSWLASNDYQPPTPYRHYSYPTNHFYDQSQWSTPPPLPPPASIPIKFETPYSPPSYNLDQTLSDSKDEISDSLYIKCQDHHQQQQNNWFKPQLTPVAPKNPINGKTRTRDKYRIVYTDRQRYELENEFLISKYISIQRKAVLSSTLALSERQIKIWFQNRRAKERKLTKKRQDICPRQINHSTDADSASEGDLPSPIYYQNYV